MPSTKKMKGRARKKKAANVNIGRAASSLTSLSCRHCESALSRPHIARFMNEFINEMQRQFNNLRQTYLLVVRSLELTHEKNPGILDVNDNRVLAKDYAVATGAMLLLDDDNDLNYRTSTAGCYAIAVLLLENYSPSKSFIQVLEEQLRQQDGLEDIDAINGCERSLIRFFRDRMPCSCLDSKYAEVKSQKAKTGMCCNCHERKQRSDLFVCQGCKQIQYCSKACQVKDWPEHKPYCVAARILAADARQA